MGAGIFLTQNERRTLLEFDVFIFASIIYNISDVLLSRDVLSNLDVPSSSDGLLSSDVISSSDVPQLYN